MSGLPTFAPPDDEVAAPFWAAIEAHEIHLPRCTACGRWQWYPTSTGADCADGELEWQPVAQTGTVYTQTQVERAFLPGGREDVPFIVAFIELDDVPGVRLIGNLDMADNVGIGDRVQADFIQGDDRTRLVFRPERVS